MGGVHLAHFTSHLARTHSRARAVAGVAHELASYRDALPSLLGTARAVNAYSAPHVPGAAIFAGVLLAGGIMTTLTLAGKWGALAALAALVVFGVGAITSSKD